MSTLISTVHVADKNGDIHIFSPGKDVPEWAAKLITNPKAWGGIKATLHPGETVIAAPDLPKVSAKVEAYVESMEAAAGATLPVPAKGGPKATVEAWTSYAHQQIAAKGLNIDIPADATRKDIIDALDAAGIATE